MVIDEAFSEFELWKAGLPQGVVAGLAESDRPEGAARTARLDVETSTRVVQATIWDSGEVDLVVGDLVSGDVLANEHREITSRLGIREMLADVLEAIKAS